MCLDIYLVQIKYCETKLILDYVNVQKQKVTLNTKQQISTK